jgi:hypothetical protein
MLNQETLGMLPALYLTGTADAYGRQTEGAGIGSLTFGERFGLLADQRWSWCENPPEEIQAGCRALCWMISMIIIHAARTGR